MRTIVLRWVALLTVAFSLGFANAAPATATPATGSGRTADPVASAIWADSPIKVRAAAQSPDTIITSGPSGLTNAHVSTFKFASSDAASTFQCRVDAGDFAACATPFTRSLPNGAHTFEVRALDGAGDPDPTPASRSFVVDTVAPQTTITSGPSGETKDNTPAFTFESLDASARFQCRVDTAEFAACATPFTATPLPNGAHTFQVRALDAVGNTDQSPARRDFTVSSANNPPPVPTCQGKTATIVGTKGDDRLRGTGGKDVIVSRGGDDDIGAGGGNDLVCAGPGNDRVAGGAGKDVILGKAGQDGLMGNGRDDHLDGGGGDDKLFGQTGDDRLDGGRGRDDGNGGPGRDVVLRCET